MSIIWLRIFNVSNTLERIINISEDLLKVCHVAKIKKYWFGRIHEVVMNSRQAGVIDIEKELISRLQAVLS